MQSVLLRRLGDDEPTVLDAALSLPSLLQMPTGVLYHALAGIMQKFRASFAEGTSSSERKAWRSVAQKVRKATIALSAGSLLVNVFTFHLVCPTAVDMSTMILVCSTASRVFVLGVCLADNVGAQIIMLEEPDCKR